MKLTNAEVGDSIFFACNKKNEIEKITSQARNKIGEELKLVDERTFAFCWIDDYPMFELDETDGKIGFSHNPFSMPQGNLEDLDFPLLLLWLLYIQLFLLMVNLIHIYL